MSASSNLASLCGRITDGFGEHFPTLAKYECIRVDAFADSSTGTASVRMSLSYDDTAVEYIIHVTFEMVAEKFRKSTARNLIQRFSSAMGMVALSMENVVVHHKAYLEQSQHDKLVPIWAKNTPEEVARVSRLKRMTKAWEDACADLNNKVETIQEARAKAEAYEKKKREQARLEAKRKAEEKERVRRERLEADPLAGCF